MPPDARRFIMRCRLRAKPAPEVADVILANLPKLFERDPQLPLLRHLSDDCLTHPNAVFKTEEVAP